ncbi:MarR family winged helix-turn-helix transcriptional regulator [Paenibacillus tepidiphilus]|uniref:MarR family winged helix-turn-helix transcriptional regulator n=1 Tax=Paenibacillus tepidiphilus TaxID=2608683 RepID=UPI00123A276E|nr:MarR family transcriptional regulator [Paenibacillus tepidiphilus]
MMRRMHKARWKHTAEGHKPSEMTLMICLSNQAEFSEEGLKVSEISRILGLTPPTVTQLVNTLEAKEMVRRQADPLDRRVVRISLTEGGEAVTMKVKQDRDEMMNRLVEHLGEEDSVKLADLLQKVFEFIKDNPPPHLDRLPKNGDEKFD